MTGGVPVLFEDEHLLVVDKPSRLLVVDAPGRAEPTLVDRLGQLRGERLYAVHRLDEDTTGVIVLARSIAARDALTPVFRGHQAERTYLAAVGRVPTPTAGRIESRLAVGPDGIVRSVTDGRGDLAITEYHLLERRERHALLRCRLDTGRRNQIRVHLADIDCPILGDRKYGWRPRNAADRAIRRPLLHAWRIAFRHPLTGAMIEVEAPPSEPELRPCRP